MPQNLVRNPGHPIGRWWHRKYRPTPAGPPVGPRLVRWRGLARRRPKTILGWVCLFAMLSITLGVLGAFIAYLVTH